ncbi:MAG: hypothetical protein GY845_06400 [Planctomycetes bacterium]|nr:hypothetical protein [Planctomycetota bacterium]
MRSTIHKQNSLIVRYCLAVAVILALVGPPAGAGLYNDGGYTTSWV